MKKQTPNLECTRKIEKGKCDLKILTLGWFQHQSQLSWNLSHLYNFRASNDEMDSKIGMYMKNCARQVYFKKFDVWSTFAQKSTLWKLDFCTIFLASNEGMGPKIGMYSKNWVGQVRFEIFDFWSIFAQKSTFLEIGRLHNFWASNEETGPKIGMYSKNWVGQIRFENFDFLVNICTKVNFFWKLDLCTIFELWMKKRVPKSEFTRKIEWDKSVLKILIF